MFSQRTTTHFTISVIVSLVLVAFFAGCGEKVQQSEGIRQTDSLADTAAVQTDTTPVFQALVDLPEDTPETFKRKAREIMEWTPGAIGPIVDALRGVTRIVRFADLGFGKELEMTMPRAYEPGWPPVQSVRLNLGRAKTAVVARVYLDTLAGPRARGEGTLAMMGIHGDTLFGRDVPLPRTEAGTGRFELLFLSEKLFAQTSCCGIPPTILLERYGKIGDTLTLMFVFQPANATYDVAVIGQDAGRVYPAFLYGRFRTERGEHQRDANEYPYVFKSNDSAHVNLFFGSCSRGLKNQFEPVLRVKMF